MAGHGFHPTLLREYDIRGIVGSTLHPADARAIGRAFGSMVAAAGGGRVVLGRDGRLSSPELAAATAEGFVAAGLEVLDIGLGPTPMMYFAVHHLGAEGGLQITGSHNPPDYHGFKMMLGTRPFYGAQIQEIGKVAAEGLPQAGGGRRIEVEVAVVPGEAFGPSGYLRLSYALGDEDLATGVARLQDFLGKAK